MPNYFNPFGNSGHGPERKKAGNTGYRPLNNREQHTSEASRSASQAYRTQKPYASMAHKAGSTKKAFSGFHADSLELRLPAPPSFKYGWKTLSAVLALSMLILIGLMLWSPAFKVQEVNLSGGLRVPAEEILNSLRLQNSKLIALQPSKTEAYIRESFPDLKTVQVKIRLPNRLDIHVEERIPAILWLQNEKDSFWIDQDGYIFPVRGEATLPIRVQANSTPPQALFCADNAEPCPSTSPDFIRAIQAYAQILPQSSQLLYDGQNGIGWEDPRGWHAYFGSNFDQINLRVSGYQKIVDTLLAKAVQPSLISMEFLHAPFYRMEP